MLGYVTCETAELKVKEYELYSAYYCGVCKSIGARYGQLARTVLSYDSVFLAMLLDGVSGNAPAVKEGSCLLHPVKGKNIAAGSGIDYAADVMLILAWFNYLDDQRDKDAVSKKSAAGESGGASGIAKQAAMKAVGKPLKKIYSELQEKYPDLCRDIAARLEHLNELEDEKCASLDEVAEEFAQLMRSIFTTGYRCTWLCGQAAREAAPESGEDEADPANGVTAGEEDPKQKKFRQTEMILSELGFHMGKWIYLMDAWEDLEKDIESGAYNPLIYRHGFGRSDRDETAAGLRERIRENVEFNLMMYLASMSSALDLLELNGNKGIIDNIIGMGLLRRTEEALGKGASASGAESITVQN